MQPSTSHENPTSLFTLQSKLMTNLKYMKLLTHLASDLILITQNPSRKVHSFN